MSTTNGVAEREGGWGFSELLLAAVIVLMTFGVLLCIALYVLPGGHLDIAELQPAARVARVEDFPVGASRLVRWGDRPILVIRAEERRYFAVQGTSPFDDCILDWEEDASRIVSPCSYVVYDLMGNVVTGLSTTPLRRYPVFVRDATVYVAGS